mgnify:FL=1
MITDYNITDLINEESYEFYYRKSRNLDKYWNALAEKADREYEMEECEND